VSQRTRWSKREHTRTNHPIFTILCSIGSDQVGGAFGRYVDAEEPASSSDGGGSAAAIVHQSINPRHGESVSVRNARARMCVYVCMCVCGLGRYVSRYHRFLFLGSLKSDSSTDVMVWNDTSPSTSCSHQTHNRQKHTRRVANQHEHSSSDGLLQQYRSRYGSVGAAGRRTYLLLVVLVVHEPRLAQCKVSLLP